MSTEILMKFLKLELIDLQGSDEKLDKLEKTSISLAKLLEANPSKTMAYTLIALDPKAPEDDPVVQETISILEENWTTYSNTFSGTPVQVIRALLLQALVNSAEENQQVAIALVSITRNILPHIEVGNEIDMWNKLVAKFESQLNIAAEKEWTTPEKISVKAFSYTVPKQIKVSSSDVVLDRVTLENDISKASGPQNKKGVATGGNNTWPNHDPTNWVYQFSSMMTSAIADTVDNAFEQAKIKPIDLSKPLQELSTAVADHIDSTLEAVSSATIGLQRRTSLIWWKESLYSQSASSSYRKMPIDIAAAVMAFDLFNQVPACSPASVSAFLYESIFLITNHNDENQVELAQRVKEVQQSPYAASLRKYIHNYFKNIKGRGLLLRLLVSDLHPDDKQFRELTGLAPNTQLSNAEWASWVFRELQAIRAVTSGENEDD
ncbi:GTPase-associated system all-helical protein GASH [Acinetobacter seifertii]|uniref:GTPase-associated system helical domain-containing protein n=1 Tax=Acinetobacter seifertii TaxID=1530123 RepID=A0A7H2QSI7_9GAMM|nr:GTPase-associated system all-helical protein GASH [Acinetobacter seifertii]QNX18070.1 hypothetical protein IC792_10200 [Acinetobacter seifertii]QNX46929.1 hypothetical protein IC785_09950 [Acinetobacter seifertii]QNX54163.1 hypothetical protein IC783_09840 [Acinetobacter seifertii]QNX74372.1 hypothetical protein IC777_10220 [Acinetobacter seifertii]QNX85399.1 hypothetical protein IC774_09840 [Acinetobacter seifertii]